MKIQIIFGFSMAGYVSLFDLGESRDDVEVDYNSLHHYRVKMFILIIVLNAFVLHTIPRMTLEQVRRIR